MSKNPARVSVMDFVNIALALCSWILPNIPVFMKVIIGVALVLVLFIPRISFQESGSTASHPLPKDRPVTAPAPASKTPRRGWVRILKLMVVWFFGWTVMGLAQNGAEGAYYGALISIMIPVLLLAGLLFIYLFWRAVGWIFD